MATPITDADFQKEVLESPIPVMVDFWAPWCGPCQVMLPLMDELTKEYEGKVKLVKINIDENIKTPEMFGVMSIPTFVIFKGGQPVASIVGARSKAEMKKQLDAQL